MGLKHEQGRGKAGTGQEQGRSRAEQHKAEQGRQREGASQELRRS